MEGKLKKTACLLLAAIMFLGIFGCSGSVIDEGEGIIDIVYAEPTPDADQTQAVQTPTVEDTPPSRDVTYMWLTNEMNVDAPNRPFPEVKEDDEEKTVPYDFDQSAEPITYETVLLGTMSEKTRFCTKASYSPSAIKGCREIGSKESVLVYGEQGSYYKVEYAFFTGYVKKDCVKLGDAADIEAFRAIPDYGEITSVEEHERETGSMTYFRTHPYKNSKRVEGCVEIPRGKTVKVTGECGDFYRIEFKSKTGFVPKSDLVLPSGSGSYSAEYAQERYAWADAINPDTVGWICLNGTNIDYPVMYDASGNYFYNDHTWRGERSSAASIYVYTRPAGRFITIAGHNSRKSKTMFNRLHKAQDAIKNGSSGYRTFYISLEGIPHTRWKLWAFYETQEDEPESTRRYNTLSFLSSSVNREWIDYQLSRSEVNLGVDVSTGCYIITLITCGDNYDSADAESRLYMFLKAG